MRNTVYIDGIKVTRAQVEQAVKDLAVPEPILQGTNVSYGGYKYIVIEPDKMAAALEVHKGSPDRVTLYCVTTKTFSYDTEAGVRSRIVPSNP